MFEEDDIALLMRILDSLAERRGVVEQTCERIGINLGDAKKAHKRVCAALGQDDDWSEM